MQIGLLPQTVKQISLFERSELRRAILVLAVATLDGIFQALGIASIMPFIAILSDPALADTSRFFTLLRDLLPLSFTGNLVWTTGLLALSVLVVSNTLTILSYWLSLRLFSEQRYRLSTRLLALYMGKELIEFNRRKISEMSTTILSEVERTVIGTLMAAVGLIADTIVALALVVLLLLVNPWATMVAVVVLGGGYLVVHLLTVREVEQLGAAHAEAESGMFASVSQALALFKEAKIHGKESYFLQRFRQPAKDVAHITNRYEILTFVPAQLTEVLAFVLLLIVALYLTGESGANFNAISVIAFYAFAAYRLVPVLKSVLDHIEEIRYGAAVVDAVLEELGDKSNPDVLEASTVVPMAMNEAIRLEQISFRYPEALAPVFSDLNAVIPAGQMTCIIGPSGAGKSTLLDMLLGLIEPDSGRCLIDDVPLSPGTRRRWQRSIGFVPQQVQFVDGTLAQNIALGETEIDYARVEAAARSAGIDRLATEQMRQGYDTPIGDGGHALSSGERQRVGIARALYHAPLVLLLDEATNELDAETEDRVISHLLSLSDATIVFVTHKQAIWERADNIVQLAGRFA